MGIAESAKETLLRLASRRNSPLICNSLSKQSQISSADAALRNGSKIAGSAAILPNNPKVSRCSVVVGVGAKKISISLTSALTRSWHLVVRHRIGVIFRDNLWQIGHEEIGSCFEMLRVFPECCECHLHHRVCLRNSRV